MTFVRNSWYAAGRSAEVGDNSLARTILGTPMVFFRDTATKVAALLDVCPHRAVPLSLGRVADGEITCPYHGLRFDALGRCRHNPHVKGPPDRIGVDTYPVVERFGLIWVWPGDGAQADPALIPDYGWFDDPDHYTVGIGYTHVAADYRLIIDNLLDLSHAEFIHPETVGTPGAMAVLTHRIEKGEGWLVSDYLIPDMPPAAFFASTWTQTPRIDQYSRMRWNAVSSLILDLGIMAPGAPANTGWHLPSAHILTPEDDVSTHYFWAFARDFDLANEELTAGIVAGGNAAFSIEDKPMIEAAQRMISKTGAKVRNFTSGDTASVYVRRRIDELIDEEKGAD